MAFLIRGQASSPVNPVLDIFTSQNSQLTDVSTLSFQIFDITTPARKTDFLAGNQDLAQVFPAAPGTRFSLDTAHLVTDTPSGHKISTGHYYAPFTVDQTASLGDWVILWYYRELPASPEKIFQEEFTVVDQGSSISAGSPIIEKLKWYMQDYFNKNELLDTVQYQDFEYQNALDFTVMRFNVIPFITSYTVDNFPVMAAYLLFLGATAHLLRSTSIEQLRNQLTYTDGNVHVGITDKHQLYISTGNTHMGEFDQLTRWAKNQLNNESAWGEVGSPYMAPLGGWGPLGSGWGWG